MRREQFKLKISIIIERLMGNYEAMMVIWWKLNILDATI